MFSSMMQAPPEGVVGRAVEGVVGLVGLVGLVGVVGGTVGGGGGGTVGDGGTTVILNWGFWPSQLIDRFLKNFIYSFGTPVC